MWVPLQEQYGIPPHFLHSGNQMPGPSDPHRERMKARNRQITGFLQALGILNGPKRRNGAWLDLGNTAACFWLIAVRKGVTTNNYVFLRWQALGSDSPMIIYQSNSTHNVREYPGTGDRRLGVESQNYSRPTSEQTS